MHAVLVHRTVRYRVRRHLRDPGVFRCRARLESELPAAHPYAGRVPVLADVLVRVPASGGRLRWELAVVPGRRRGHGNVPMSLFSDDHPIALLRGRERLPPSKQRRALEQREQWLEEKIQQRLDASSRPSSSAWKRSSRQARQPRAPAADRLASSTSTCPRVRRRFTGCSEASGCACRATERIRRAGDAPCARLNRKDTDDDRDQETRYG